MYVQNQRVSSVIDGIIGEVCKNLFEAYGVKLEAVERTMEEEQSLVLCGVLGFAGSAMRGSLLLAGTKTPFEQSRPVEGEMRDWVGELANQLVGRLKSRLLQRGVDIALSTPIVIQGEHIAPLPRQILQPAIFRAHDGLVAVWVDVETTPDFTLGEPIPIEAPSEDGEALFF